MSESFVDLSYRGLALGKHVKLTQVRPTTGYLEMPTPMPVGTAIAIATDDGLSIEATVAEIREQTTGDTRTPGMVVRPRLDADVAKQWWTARVGAAEVARPERAEIAPVVGTVLPKRMTTDVVVPVLEDDGRTTAVMSAIDPDGGPTTAVMAAVDPDAPDAPDSRTTVMAAVEPPVQDDGKRTVAMAAVDLAALGLDAARVTGGMPAVAADDDDPASGSGDKPEKPGAKRKRKKVK